MIELAQTASTWWSAVDWLALGERALWAIGGVVSGLLAAYVVVIRDVSYIKGVVDQLNSNDEEVATLRRDVDLLKYKQESQHGNTSKSAQHEPAVGLR